MELLCRLSLCQQPRLYIRCYWILSVMQFYYCFVLVWVESVAGWNFIFWLSAVLFIYKLWHFFCKLIPYYFLLLSLFSWVVLVMVLKPTEFGGIPFLSEESAPWSIVRIGPYLNILFVYRHCNEDLLSVLIFWFPYFGWFQVKVQFFFKCEVDYIVLCEFWIAGWNFIGMKLDLVVIYWRLFLWCWFWDMYTSPVALMFYGKISRNIVVVPEGVAGLIRFVL
jgi:hypothetical protein